MDADDALPPPVVAEDSLDDIRLSTLDETDDFHRAAALGTRQRVDFIHSLDQPRPRGNRTLARAAAGGSMCVAESSSDGPEATLALRAVTNVTKLKRASPKAM